MGIAALVVARGSLPERIATHFDLAGNADGHGSRDAFLLTFAAVIVGNAALFLGLAWLLPRVPDSLVNLPHKAYWLAPSRREASLAAVAAALQRIAAATTALLVVEFALACAANRAERPALSPASNLALGAYLVYVGVAAWRLHRRFRVLPPGG